MFRIGFLGLDWVERGLLIGCIMDIGIDVSLNPMSLTDACDMMRYNVEYFRRT